MGMYANQEVFESTVTTTATLTFAKKSRVIEVINDSGTRDLQFRLHSSETYASLKPLEAISIPVWTAQLYLNSPSAASVAYRVRVYG